MLGFRRAAAEPAYATTIIARLNARVQPLDRGEYFEDPLEDVLSAQGIGEVTGGGTEMCGEPDGIACIDIDIAAIDSTPETLRVIIDALEAAGAPKGSFLRVDNGPEQMPFGKLEGMALFLNGTDLPPEVYANSDVNALIAEFNRLLDGLGEFRGYWEGSRETALYFYGTSFRAMAVAVRERLDTDPACALTRVVQIA